VGLGVITSYYRAPEGHIQTKLGTEAIAQALRSGQGLLWLDLEAVERPEGAVLEQPFGFHHLAIDDCFNRHVDPPKIDDFGDYLFIIAQAVDFEALGDRIATTELDLFLGPNYVVSFHSKPLPFVEELRRRCDSDGPELKRGAEFLAHALLDAMVDDFQPIVEQLDDRLEPIEEHVLRNPQPATLQDILLLKRNAQRLRRTIIPQRDVMNRLSRGEFPRLIRPEANVYFRDIYDHTVRVEQLVESLRDLADGVLNSYLSSINNRMNEIMKTLSVVAAFFLPLTFIASIYGMNFEHMPELGWRIGYYGVLAIMAVVAASLFVFFRWRRWF
jgi:magnesium transporter